MHNVNSHAALKPTTQPQSKNISTGAGRTRVSVAQIQAQAVAAAQARANRKTRKLVWVCMAAFFVAAFAVYVSVIHERVGDYFKTAKTYTPPGKDPEGNWLENQFGNRGGKSSAPLASAPAENAVVIEEGTAQERAAAWEQAHKVVVQQEVGQNVVQASSQHWSRDNVLERGALAPNQHYTIAAANAPANVRINIRMNQQQALSASLSLDGIQAPKEGMCRSGDSCTLWISFNGGQPQAFTAQVHGQRSTQWSHTQQSPHDEQDGGAQEQEAMTQPSSAVIANNTRLYLDNPARFTQNARMANSIRITTERMAQDGVVLDFNTLEPLQIKTAN